MNASAPDGAPVAIVTGASRGIGRAIAQTLAARGYRLVLAARTLDAAQAADGVRIVALDLRARDAADLVVARALAAYGRIDLLVNNAGATPRGDFLGFDDDAWDDGFALKFFGAMRLCRTAWPHLVAARGTIVNIAGIGGRTGSAEFAIGGAVNAALLNLTKALADRGVRDGVRVNAVNPSGIATGRTQMRIDAVAAERGIAPEAAARALAAELRIARFGTPEEVAEVVAFLASPAAAYLQGAIVDVDGGQTRTL